MKRMSIILFLMLCASVAQAQFMPFGMWKPVSGASTVYPFQHRLIAAWQFETNGNDTTGNAFNLTANNSPSYAAGRVNIGGRVVSPNQSSWSIADRDSLDLVGTDFTITGWVYLDHVANASVILTKGTDIYSANRRYTIALSQGERKFWFYVDSATTLDFLLKAPTLYTYGSWYFFAAGFSASRSTYWIMVNDSTKDSIATGRRVQPSTYPLYIGYDQLSDGNKSITATFDQFLIWRRELTPAELAYLYNSGNGRSFQTLWNYAP